MPLNHGRPIETKILVAGHLFLKEDLPLRDVA